MILSATLFLPMGVAQDFVAVGTGGVYLKGIITTESPRNLAVATDTSAQAFSLTWDEPATDMMGKGIEGYVLVRAPGRNALEPQRAIWIPGQGTSYLDTEPNLSRCYSYYVIARFGGATVFPGTESTPSLPVVTDACA